MRTEFLRPIDGLRLVEEYRALLRPGESEAGVTGIVHRLPLEILQGALPL